MNAAGWSCVYVGPFQRSEMAGWHSAGFFTHNLLVKRGADASFIQLGETNVARLHVIY